MKFRLASAMTKALALFLSPFARRIRVEGLSMVPTLAPGETTWALRRWRRVRVGDVVAVADPTAPKRELVKRVAHLEGREAWLVGDNEAVSVDSRSFGAVPVRRIRWFVVVPHA